MVDDTASSPLSSTSPKHRVLVIENDVATADLMVSVLENAGYELEVATDGPYGLMLLDSFQPELILMGSLQRMSGMEVTQTIRSAPQYSARFRNMQIIYLTDNKQLLQQRFQTLPDTPMSEYIFKPIDVQELVNKVARAFEEPDGQPST